MRPSRGSTRQRSSDVSSTAIARQVHAIVMGLRGPNKLDDGASSLSLPRAVRAFMAGYFSTCRRSAKTEAAYDYDLKQFAKNFSSRTVIEAVTPEMVEQWMAALRARNYAPASVRRKLAALRVFFHYWLRRRAIATSPLWSVRLDFGEGQRLVRSLSASEAALLLDCARREARLNRCSSRLALRNLALLEILFATGIRVGEASRLLTTDLLAEQNGFVVRGKGDRHRLAFLVDKHSQVALRQYLAARRRWHASLDPLFVNAAGGPISTQGIADIVSSIASKAGIGRKVTPHMLRHTAATLLMQNGANIRVVQEFLGHASISTTQRYTHVSKEHLIEELRLRHPNRRRSMIRGPRVESHGSERHRREKTRKH